jgi:hypothetical protein
MTDLHRILEELAGIDRSLAEPGAATRLDRDALLRRRRSLNGQFAALQHRPDYLEQVSVHTSSVAAEGLF